MPAAPRRSPLLIAFAIVLTLVMAFIQLDFIEYAYERIGVAPQYVFAVLIASLLGSSINIPISVLHGETPPQRAVAADGPTFTGDTILAVNVGGAIIPSLLCAYLLMRGCPLLSAGAATLIVSAAVHWMARPVPGMGIAVPVLIPPLVAAAAALMLAPAHAPAVAYIGGTLGTLIGADLTNLHRLGGLGAPVASIGGAGTFDGIFVTGILAVLLA